MFNISSVKYMINPRATASLSPTMRDEERLHVLIDYFGAVYEEVVVAPPFNGSLSPRFIWSLREI